ncbi:MAG: peptide-methionine (R)-S-oxide reductase MsrB [Armatimonadetes bacterium]|nr:peptide-methionine (R)-S-oxide reductase MsrB [Armatimonadota bacterium]
MKHAEAYPLQKSDEEWRRELTPEEYHLLRNGGTERPGTGRYLHQYEDGQYRCAGCGQVLFRAREKFDSGSGWPSWWAAAAEDRIRRVEDSSFGMRRVEVVCSQCGGHLGHVFEDGPTPTGERY